MAQDQGIVFEENRIENAKKKKNDVDHSKLMKNLSSIKQAINDAGFEHDSVPGKVFAHIKEAHNSIHRAINALTPHMQNGDDMHPSDVDMDDPRKANDEFELKNAGGKGWKVGDKLVSKSDHSLEATVVSATDDTVSIKFDGGGAERMNRDGIDIEDWRKKA